MLTNFKSSAQSDTLQYRPKITLIRPTKDKSWTAITHFLKSLENSVQAQIWLFLQPEEFIILKSCYRNALAV